MIGGLVDILIPPALSPVGNDVPEQIYDLEPADVSISSNSAPKAAPVALVPVFPMNSGTRTSQNIKGMIKRTPGAESQPLSALTPKTISTPADARQERKPLQIEHFRPNHSYVSTIATLEGKRPRTAKTRTDFRHSVIQRPIIVSIQNNANGIFDDKVIPHERPVSCNARSVAALAHDKDVRLLSHRGDSAVLKAISPSTRQRERDRHKENKPDRA